MKSEILSQEQNVVLVKATYEVDEVAGAVQATVKELSKKVTIKGFRKGHVPRKTLELFVGRDSIYRETIENLAQDAMDSIVTEYELNLITQPTVKFDELKEGEPFDIEFTFEVRPEVELPDLSELSAEKLVYTVTDEDVEESFGQLLQSNAKLEAISDDRPAEKDDIVEVEYTSYTIADDGSEKELEKEQKSTLNLSIVRPEIAESIVGQKPAAEFSFEMTLEDDYPDPRMAGAKIRYQMEILEFKKRVVPEATDEAVKEITQGKYETVDALKEELRKQMDAQAEEKSDSSLREAAIIALADAAKVEIPESMINRQFESMKRDQESQIQRDLQKTLAQYIEENNLKIDEFENNLRKRAAEIVRNTLVLDALAERDNITFDSDGINEEIMSMARASRVNPQELADMISKNSDEFTSLAMRVRTKNTIKHLAQSVKAIETEPKKEEPATDKSSQTAESEGEE